MKNNYSSLKGGISYFLVSAIIFKLYIFPNQKTFQKIKEKEAIENHIQQSKLYEQSNN